MSLRSGSLGKAEAWASNNFRRLKAWVAWPSHRRLSIASMGAAAAVLLAVIVSASSRELLLWGLLLPAAVIVNVEIVRRHKARLQSAVTALRESEGKFRCVVENAQDAIVVTAASGNIAYWNKAAESLFGYTKSEAAGRSPHDILCPRRYREKALKEYAQFASSGCGQRLNKPVTLEALRKDGTEFPVEILVSGFPSKCGWSAVTSIRDVSEQKRALAELERRSKLLHAISLATNTLLANSQLDDAINKVLEIIGRAADVDRIRVYLTKRLTSSSFQYAWRSPTLPETPWPGFTPLAQTEFDADPIFAPLREFKPVPGITRTMTAGTIKTYCASQGIRSFVVIPIGANGNYQGQIAFSDCKAEREWSQSEIDTLCIVTGIIGASIVREHYVHELEDAKRIIEGSATILFRMGGEPSLPLIYVSHNVASLGYDPEELIASPQLYNEAIHPDERGEMQMLHARILAEGQPFRTSFRVRKRDGSYAWFETHFRPIWNANGQVSEIEGTMTDITRRKEAELKIAALAKTDPLTGIANRATFIERLEQAFAHCKAGAKPFAVLYIDLDRFKDVNDTLGHSAGDILLKAAVDRLAKTCKTSDLVARLGGDEFAILQTGLSGPSDIAPFVSKIHARLAEPFQLGESEVHLGASIGISFYTEGTESPDELLSQADLALYRAKDEGRDQYRFHSDDLDREVRERVSLTEDLRHALANEGELELYYQPQIEVSTGRIAGMEALIRWHHPVRGLLLPARLHPRRRKVGGDAGLGAMGAGTRLRANGRLAQGRGCPGHLGDQSLFGTAPDRRGADPDHNGGA